MRQIDIVIKSTFDRRPGSKLCFRPEPKNSRGHHVGARVSYALQLSHFVAVVHSFSFSSLRFHKVFQAIVAADVRRLKLCVAPGMSLVTSAAILRNKKRLEISIEALASIPCG